MKKCIYFGEAKGFWYPNRFKNFMESLDSIEVLIENNFTPMANALNIPLIYYFNKHNAIIKYERQETFQPEPYHTLGGCPGLIRAKVDLFGDERNMEDLEWLIKEEAKKNSVDYIK